MMINKLLQLAKALLPHVVIDMAVCFIVFLVLNKYNPMMAFLSNEYSQILLIILCVGAIVESIVFIAQNRRN